MKKERLNMETLGHDIIPLWSRDDLIGFALVDTDFARANDDFKWHVVGRKSTHPYAVRRVWLGDRSIPIAMHREVLGLPHSIGKDGLRGDHINHDTLDNRRSNLRIVTHAQNAQNRKVAVNSTSRVRGVYWDSTKSLWAAGATLDGIFYKMGTFATELEAAESVSNWRRENMPYANEGPDQAEIEKLRAKMKEQIL